MEFVAVVFIIALSFGWLSTILYNRKLSESIKSHRSQINRLRGVELHLNRAYRDLLIALREGHFTIDRPTKDTKRALNDKSKEVKE